jgi:hypothetical protein
VQSQPDEGRNLRFPIYALCIEDPDQPDQDFLAEGDLDGRRCVAFYHNQELAELAVEQAARQTEMRHHLLRIDGKDYLIDILKTIPHEIRWIVWNKQLEAAGMYDMQVIDCLLGWQIRHR